MAHASHLFSTCRHAVIHRFALSSSSTLSSALLFSLPLPYSLNSNIVRHYCCSISTPTPGRKRLVSGIQPSGSLHLGNYLGTMKSWSTFQDTYETLLFIVDLHAITQPQNTWDLAQITKSTAALFLACGVDEDKVTIFVQSHVHAHVELMWLLSTLSPVGRLNRMIQFKEKSGKQGDENVGVALLTYPVLMASDILLYQADYVSVGDDQRQHLELTRDLAERVNSLYGNKCGGSLLKVPSALVPSSGARIMSLSDGLTKMSKSAPSELSRINLLDSKDAIANKIKRCKTDGFLGLEFDNVERPECNNLLSIYQSLSGRTKAEVQQECKDMTWSMFKQILTDVLIEHLHPIQVRFKEIMIDVTYLDRILLQGSESATFLANETLRHVYKAMGFLHK